MQNFITALKAEHIKKKGTGIYMLSILLGAISPVIWTIVQLFEKEKPGSSIPYNYYISYIEGLLEPFAGFFFPLLIIITVSRITQLDHKNGGWQLMETQPIRKISIYFSKFSVVLISNLIAILSLVIVGYLGGWIISLIKGIPQDATTNFAFAELFWIIIRLFLAGLFLTAFQYVISVLLPSFIWSILIGFFLLLAFIFLKVFNVTPDYYPLELLDKVATFKKGSQLGYWITYSETLSVLCSIIALYIGFEWYKHKNLKLAFFSKSSRALKLIAVLVVFGGLLTYVLMPNTMESHNKTVISGKIEGDKPFQAIYITNAFADDTLAVIPVKNNTFHYVIEKEVPFDNYSININNAANGQITFGKNDSIHLNIKQRENNFSVTTTGSRLAENQYEKTKIPNYGMASYYIEENIQMDNPDLIRSEIVKEWKEALSTSDKYKTVDNYVPREDFMERNKKMLTITFLNLWNDFVKKRAVMFPKEKTEETTDIKLMKKRVPLDDESLLSNEEYFKYVRSQMIAPNKEDIDENTKSLLAIAKLPKGEFKDKMLYWQLNSSIKDASTTAERAQLLAQYGTAFSNKKYFTYTLANNKLIESLGKGMPAPLFDATSQDGKQFNLADFKGKYLMIDVWATWCGPCKKESPLFEKMAIKYKKEPIQFIALSTDQKIDKWLVEAKAKSKSVLQLHINNDNQFSKGYDIQFIPRFILIDPQGNFVNSKMPSPSDKIFEKLLRETLSLPEEK